MNANTPNLWDEMRRRFDAGDRSWIPTTEEMYHEMLNVLPPAYWRGGVFAVGEPWRHTGDNRPIFACFRASHGAHSARYATLAEVIQP